ncbi:MAG: SH3 domain-containing protein [Tenuifilaceae bacterium]|nr:SH3 domain-containing protein [Tenuifilaceae bacterium]
MKHFILTFCLLAIPFVNLISQEKRGIINDPDGFSNVRELPDGKSKIIDQIVDGEIFYYTENNENWYPVRTYKGVNGFVHKSRIKEFKLNIECFPTNNLKEVFIFRKSRKIISVCGIPDKKENNIEFYSGLYVSDYLNKKHYIEFLEGAYQSFAFSNEQITVYEYDVLPINSDFLTQLTPYSINRVFFIGGRVVTVKNAPFYKYPILSNEYINREISELRNKTISEKDFYKVINISLVFALNDNSIGKQFFLNLQKELNIAFDGEYGLKYRDALKVYEINKNYR